MRTDSAGEHAQQQPPRVTEQAGWRGLVEGLPDMVWTCTAEGQCDYVNRRWTEFTGRPLAEQLGRGWVQFVHEEDRAGLRTAWERAVARREEFCADMRIRRWDGVYLWFMSCGVPAFDAQGELTGWFGSCMEIERLKKVESQLRDSEHHWRALADALPQLVWTARPDGVVDHCGEQVRVFGGFHRRAAGDWDWASALHPEDRERTQRAWQAAVAAGEVYEIEHRLRMADGSWRWFVSRAVPVRDEQASVRRWFGTSTDIQARKEAEEWLAQRGADAERQAAEMQAVFDSLENPIFVYDASGRLIHTNRAAAQLCGTATLPLNGPGLASVVECLRIRRPGGVPITLGQLPSRRALRGEPVPGERLELTTADGRDVLIMATAAPLVFEGRIVGAVASWHDITEREQLLRQVTDSAATLEHRVAERTAELTEANRELEGFTYSVAHDLRAPLRHVAGFARVLRRQAGERLGPEEREFLQNIESAIERMGQLIDDLLKFSWASRVRLRSGPVCLRAILEQARQTVLTETQARQIEWRVPDALPLVHGDATLLQQVFVNLLSNAIKFTRQTARPVIEVGAETSGEWATVFVRDNGIGFDPRYADKLFEIFERLHDPQQFEGTGIGLALVQRIVQRHGGQVRAASQPGQGATFYLTLPLAAAREEPFTRAAA